MKRPSGFRIWLIRAIGKIYFGLGPAPHVCAFHISVNKVRFAFLTDRANCKYCKRNGRKGQVNAKHTTKFDSDDWPAAGSY